MTFSDIRIIISHSTLWLCSHLLSFTLIKHLFFFVNFALQTTWTLLLTPLYCSPTPLPLQWSYFPCLVSAVTPGFVLTSEDFELGISNAKEHVTFIFLGVGYLTKYNLSSSSQLSANHSETVVHSICAQ